MSVHFKCKLYYTKHLNRRKVKKMKKLLVIYPQLPLLQQVVNSFQFRCKQNQVFLLCQSELPRLHGERLSKFEIHLQSDLLFRKEVFSSRRKRISEIQILIITKATKNKGVMIINIS